MSAITISVAPGQTEVIVDQDIVQDWIDAAESWEVSGLDIDHECDCPYPEVPEEIGPHILINMREDAGSVLDLQRIQEICNGLHVSDILAKLQA